MGQVVQIIQYFYALVTNLLHNCSNFRQDLLQNGVNKINLPDNGNERNDHLETPDAKDHFANRSKPGQDQVHQPFILRLRFSLSRGKQLSLFVQLIGKKLF
jgi:hypothetical protein